MRDKFTRDILKNELRLHLSKYKPFHHLRDSTVIWSAFELAWEAHDDQFREQADSTAARIPYITHPVGVAKLCVNNWKSGELSDSPETVVVVALLHDVLEDSAVEYTFLEGKFGSRVADLCEALSKPPRTSNQTRAERNDRAAEKILLAGASAVYVKACDALHNLSRPLSMPISLLEKTLEKVSGPYSRLIAGHEFENRLTAEFAIAIEGGRKAIFTARDQNRSYDPFSYQSVVDYLSRRCASKVFEEHDIVSFFLSLPQVANCFIGTIEQVDSNFFGSQGLLGPEAISRLRKRSELAGNFLPNSESNLVEISKAKVISVPLFNPLVLKDERRLCILTLEDCEIRWFSPSLISSIMTVLTERLVSIKRENALELAALINSHDLDLDVHEADRMSMTASEVLTLSRYVDSARTALNSLLVQLDAADLSVGGGAEIERIESRLKSLTSALRKMENRSFSNVVSLDDFVGFRFVSLSVGSRDKLVERLRLFLVNIKNGGIGQKIVSQNDFKPVKKDSFGGYSAIHMYFEVISSGDKPVTVGCEFQIRTIAEDAIARILHELTYKNSIASKSSTRKLNKALSDVREEIDRLLSGFQRQ